MSFVDICHYTLCSRATRLYSLFMKKNELHLFCQQTLRRFEFFESSLPVFSVEVGPSNNLVILVDNIIMEVFNGYRCCGRRDYSSII